jgi:hypothetical protein
MLMVMPGKFIVYTTFVRTRYTSALWSPSVPGALLVTKTAHPLVEFYLGYAPSRQHNSEPRGFLIMGLYHKGHAAGQQTLNIALGSNWFRAMTRGALAVNYSRVTGLLRVKSKKKDAQINTSMLFDLKRVAGLSKPFIFLTGIDRSETGISGQRTEVHLRMETGPTSKRLPGINLGTPPVSAKLRMLVASRARFIRQCSRDSSERTDVLSPQRRRLSVIFHWIAGKDLGGVLYRWAENGTPPGAPLNGD